jgi:hypothetical protein
LLRQGKRPGLLDSLGGRGTGKWGGGAGRVSDEAGSKKQGVCRDTLSDLRTGSRQAAVADGQEFAIPMSERQPELNLDGRVRRGSERGGHPTKGRQLAELRRGRAGCRQSECSRRHYLSEGNRSVGERQGGQALARGRGLEGLSVRKGARTIQQLPSSFPVPPKVGCEGNRIHISTQNFCGSPQI